MDCVNCKKNLHVVYGFLRNDHWCQMCAATCVMKEDKPRLSAVVVKESDARLSSTRVTESHRPVGNNKDHI